ADESASLSSPMILPKEVHEVLKRHMLADGMPVVFDLERSRGPWLRDARTGEEYLDFFTCFASWPIGYNHPALFEKEFLEKRRVGEQPEQRGPVHDADGGVRAGLRDARDAEGIPAPLLDLRRGARGRERAQDGLRLEGAQDRAREHHGRRREPRGAPLQVCVP